MCGTHFDPTAESQTTQPGYNDRIKFFTLVKTFRDLYDVIEVNIYVISPFLGTILKYI